MVVHARIDHGVLEVDEGPLAEADLVLATDTSLHRLLTGELAPGEAIKSGSIRISGKRELLERFVDVFHIPHVSVALPA
jgi:putative sterol carrier protein